MLEVAKGQLSAANVPDIEALNRRLEAVQEDTVNLLQLHNQVLAKKNVHLATFSRFI